MNIGGDKLYIADELDANQEAEIGIYLAFGNYEEEFITRDDAIEMIKHLSNIFSITDDDLKQ